MTTLAAVILAAGQGTRMKSKLPKVLHPVAGLPMILWSIEGAERLGADCIALVVGHGADDVRALVGERAEYAEQRERLGTGHAALQARDLLLGRSDSVLVLYGDMPTLRLETLERLVALQRDTRAALALLSVEADDSMGFGRVVRDASGDVQAIVEEAVATPEIMALRELNCGVYCFDAGFLWEYLPRVQMTMPKGEYYLTDMVGLAVDAGLPVQVHTIDDVDEVQGINNRVHLARSEKILRGRIAEQVMLDGVTILDPSTTYIDASVRIQSDTVINPNTMILGHTQVGEHCVLGPNSVLRDAEIGDHCVVQASVVEQARMDDGANIGPYGHLRPGAHLGRGVHMGNFGEVKNAFLAPGTKMGHFSYVGDAEIGENVNIGAGAVTCNFDGQRKHRTTIEAESFVGSGSLLVAPVHVGKQAVIGAGSVVTHDVPDGSLVYGVPAREKPRKEGRVSDEHKAGEGL